jgi:outer membrane lipoprotein SlyB
MKTKAIYSFLLLILSVTMAHADVVVLRDGKSYSGTYDSAANSKLSFQDNAGIQYTFPINDVQSLVFSNVGDHITLHNGQTYSGQLTGTTKLSFQGSNGVSYVFPISDVSSLILTGIPPMQAGNQMQQGPPPRISPMQTGQAPIAASAHNGIPSLVIPTGTPIVVRTVSPIDSTKDAAGKLYSAQIRQDVVDSTGAVAIPAGTKAKLQILQANSGGFLKGQNLALDLYSVDINGRQYRVDTSSVTENSKSNVGMNRTTAEYAGGGGVLGALLGAAFGGGRGAGIGALAGAGGGVVTQLFTHGKQVKVPAETTLTFQLTQTLVLHP